MAKIKIGSSKVSVLPDGYLDLEILSHTLYRRKPAAAPNVFRIRSSTSVPLELNNWLTSIRREKENPARRIYKAFPASFQIRGTKKPNGRNITILA